MAVALVLLAAGTGFLVWGVRTLRRQRVLYDTSSRFVGALADGNYVGADCQAGYWFAAAASGGHQPPHAGPRRSLPHKPA